MNPYLLLVLCLVGAGFLFMSPFTKAGRTAPRWVICALVLIPTCFFIWGGLSCYLLLCGTSLSKTVSWRIMFGKTIIGSFGAGVLTALFMSGEITRRWRERAHGGKSGKELGNGVSTKSGTQ